MSATFYYYAPVKLASKERSFWLQWVFLTLVGFLVSLLFVEIGVRPYVGVVQGFAGGAAIGLAQWAVLRQLFPQASRWILASALSWGLIGASSLGALGWMAPTNENIAFRLIHGVFDGALVGALTGLAQWLTIQKQVAKDGTWIFASAASWALGLPLGWAVGWAVRLSTRLFLGELVGLAVTWLAVSALTGVALIRLLGRAAPKKL